jgi:hypothetical protein
MVKKIFSSKWLYIYFIGLFISFCIVFVHRTYEHKISLNEVNATIIDKKGGCYKGLKINQGKCEYLLYFEKDGEKHYFLTNPLYYSQIKVGDVIDITPSFSYSKGLESYTSFDQNPKFDWFASIFEYYIYFSFLIPFMVLFIFGGIYGGLQLLLYVLSNDEEPTNKEDKLPQ